MSMSGKSEQTRLSRLTTDIPATLHKKLKMQAVIENRPIRAILIELVEAYLKNPRVRQP